MSPLSKQEFLTYLMLYAAHADMIETSEERAYILNRIHRPTYLKVHKIFDHDTDVERLDVIIANLQEHNYDYEKPEGLMTEIEAVLKADGDLEAAEHSFLLAIKRIIAKASS